MWTYDCEVFAHDHLVVFHPFGEPPGEALALWNNGEAVGEFLNEHPTDIFAGFNTKHYDRFILTGMVGGLTAEELKQVNDWIISGEQGWNCPLLSGMGLQFNNVDIMDDMQMGLSLKAIEGHLGMDIRETEVDFDINRPLTAEEIEMVTRYCLHDVMATERLIKVRRSYLDTKVNIGRMVGIAPEKAMAMTNAKLTAAFLGAQKPNEEWKDERKYRFPDNLKREYIPEEVFEFFERMYDRRIPDEELFSSKLELMIGNSPGVIGFGGIHSAIPNYVKDVSK